MNALSANQLRINKATDAYVNAYFKTYMHLIKKDLEGARSYFTEMEGVKLPYFTDRGKLVYESPESLIMRVGIETLKKLLSNEERQKLVNDLENILHPKTL